MVIITKFDDSSEVPLSITIKRWLFLTSTFVTLFVVPALCFVGVMYTPELTKFVTDFSPIDDPDPEAAIMFFVVTASVIPIGLYGRREKAKQARDYLKFMGYKYLVNERIFFKKVFLYSLIALAYSIILLSLNEEFYDGDNAGIGQLSRGDLLPLAILFSSFIIVLQTSFVLADQNKRRDFALFFTKACFSMAITENDLLKKRFYFDYGLKFYNSHLKKSLNRQFYNIERIYLRLILQSPFAQRRFIESIMDTMREDNEHVTVTKWARFMNMAEAESVLKTQSLKEKIREHRYFITFVSVIISVASLLVAIFK